MRQISYPGHCDDQYGEWLRGQIIVGQRPAPQPDTDLASLMTSVRSSRTALRVPSLREITTAVPPSDIRRTIGDISTPSSPTPELIEQIGRWTDLDEFTSPVALPASAPTGLTVAGVLAGLERALRLRHH